MLVVFMTLAALGAWLALRDAASPGTPVGPAPRAAPGTLPAGTGPAAPAPVAGQADAEERPVDEGRHSDPSALGALEPPRLRVEFVDEAGRPVEGAVEVEIRGRPALGEGFVSPPRFAARGPRVERELPFPHRVPDDGPIQLAARAARLYGEAGVQPLAPSSGAWERVVLRATSTVTGSVLDARGDPLEGVPILLRDDVPGREAHTRTATDAAGRFTLEALPGRANRLFVGDAAYPWVRAIPIDAAQGPRELEPIRVELHTARFQVLRADGVPARGARLEGIGLEGGRFALELDEEGRATVRTLLAGRWRVNASDAEHGRASRAVEIPLATDEPVLFLLPR
ncbi:MAG: carboxypeptidase regulatory-like domain-containing protein [Planctomycetes bacterium]|nr:carboxypeptidase regulatory-like domain-containing protein [Planctomycetota bacterium]